MNARVDPKSLPLQTREAPIGSVDVAARVVEVVFTTGAPVRRRRYVGWDTSVLFDEILTVTREAVNLTRLNAGAPALDSHSMWSTFSQVGVVESARIEGGNGLAFIRFPSQGTDPASERMFGMVEQKIIRNVSVGYTIDEVEVVEPEKVGEIEKRIVKRWTPFEISFVTVNADAGAQTRSTEQLATFPLVVTRGLAVPAAAPLARMRMRQAGAALGS